MGSKNRSAIATLVERTTRFVMLVRLPDGHNDRAGLLGAHRDSRHFPGRTGAFVDLGPGQRDGLPR
jgi:hypothetical protein